MGHPSAPAAPQLIEPLPLPLQLRHYKASLALLRLQPGGQSREFGELVHFVAQARTTRVSSTAGHLGSSAGHASVPGSPPAHLRRRSAAQGCARSGSGAAQVAHCYPAETGAFPGELMELLGGSFAQLPSPLRLVLVKALVLLHNRGRLTSLQAVPFFLGLFRHHDKAVRRLLFQHILAGAPRRPQRV